VFLSTDVARVQIANLEAGSVAHEEAQHRLQSLWVRSQKLIDDYLRAAAAGRDAQKLRDEVEQHPEQVVTPVAMDFREEEHQHDQEQGEGSRSSPEHEVYQPELEEAQESRRSLRSVRPRKA